MKFSLVGLSLVCMMFAGGCSEQDTVVVSNAEPGSEIPNPTLGHSGAPGSAIPDPVLVRT
jgi:hypothetical protein